MWQVLVPAALAVVSQREKQKHERKMKRIERGQTDWTPIILAGTALLIVNKVFGSPTKEEKEELKATESIEDLPLAKNPFEPGFQPPPAKPGYIRSTLKATELPGIVKKIEGGVGYIWDNEAAIMGGIKRARTKTDLWIISNYYDKKYKEDLYTTLKQNLSKSELGKVNKFAIALPYYLKKA